MWPEAIAEVERISGNVNVRVGSVSNARVGSLRGYVLARAGRTDEAQQVLATLLERSRRVDDASFEIALVYAGLGANDRAFEWIDRAIEQRSLSMDHQYEPVQGLKSDPRYDHVRERLGIQKR